MADERGGDFARASFCYHLQMRSKFIFQVFVYLNLFIPISLKHKTILKYLIKATNCMIVKAERSLTTMVSQANEVP